jgi:hypothetical protein
MLSSTFVSFIARGFGPRPHTVRVGLPRERGRVRTAAPHVLEGLRRIDAAADLYYVGWNTWRLCTWGAPQLLLDIGRRIREAERLALSWELPRVKANPGAFRRLLARYEFWVDVYRGMRPIADYTGEPTGAIVDDFRRMDWLYRHTSDDAVLRALNADKDRAAADAVAEFADIGRARDAWRYVFTRSHWVGDPGQRQRPRSGFTTHRPLRAIAAATLPAYEVSHG